MRRYVSTTLAPAIASRTKLLIWAPIGNKRRGNSRKKAYPVYDSTYREALALVREFLQPLRNLQLIRQELTNFIALSQSGKAERIAYAYAGFRAVEIADAIYRSSKEQKIRRLTTPFRMADF